MLLTTHALIPEFNVKYYYNPDTERHKGSMWLCKHNVGKKR